MNAPSDTPLRHSGIFFLIARRLRAPLILLIVIMAVSVLGMTLIPGQEVDGTAYRMSIFHAFYFISYTATTIGFGEVPAPFSEQQRLWAIFCIYLSVVGWTYMLGTFFSLLGDRHLQNAIRLQRFMYAVKRLREPFYLVCGYGETGRLICRALDALGHRAVVIDIDTNKINEVGLHAYSIDVLALTADVRNPETLQIAGLTKRNCLGILALTNSDEANLAVAISARLLSPSLPALCRAETRETAANMASFGTDHIINPFEKFGEYLALALYAPKAWQLITWLTSQSGNASRTHRDPPPGEWIVCGHGRFGRIMTDALSDSNVKITVIDREPATGADIRWIQGEATGSETLLQAGAKEAVGILAGTRNDVENLSIAVTAREVNPQLFVIVRQNLYANHALFDAFKADMTVVPAEIVANECLAILSTPLLALFLAEIRKQDEEWCARALDRMTKRFADEAPLIWSVNINLSHAPALYRQLMKGEKISLGTILSSPSNRYEALPCEVLYLLRGKNTPMLIPASDTLLQPGDQLLLAGRQPARDALALTFANLNALSYVRTGEDMPGGALWEYLARRKSTAKR